MSRKWSEIFGWYGVVAILAAYLLNNFSLIGSHSLYYLVLNLTGAMGIVVDSVKQKDYQPMVLNIVWALVALVSLIKVLFL